FLQNASVFDASELTIMRDSLGLLRHDVHLLHSDSLDQSHHGRPVILTQVHGGGRGRPRLVIDPTWLRWAYGHKSIADIARFLNIHRSTVRAALIEYGISECRSDPFAGREDTSSRVTSYTQPLTDISDDDLDTAVRELRRLPSDVRGAGLIRWRIVIHGFIDGYSRLIVGLRASNNNRGSTVLDVFLNA
ncbi:uncharacterized protein B0H18DRAFT_862262, partial [Fomitopsis serialis]|uniref:uncharacterized protein n=1 Tax=Fomitopsis serialis TaxID=139415 RepID=UPI0020074DBC